MAVQLITRKFTLTEYHQMAEKGIFSEDDRIELKEKLSPCHLLAFVTLYVDRLNRLFNRIFPQSVIIRGQNPIAWGDDLSETQPDLAIASYRDDFS